MQSERREKRILLLSFFAGLAFAIVEFIFSILSHSQSVLMDAVYDGTELVFIALILFLTPLFHKPVSEKHPYGYFQVESIFIIIKGFMMISVSVSASVEIIETALSGGNEVNELSISAFQLVLGLACSIIYIAMKNMNKHINSPTVDAELLGWKMDITYSIGLSIAFFLAIFFKGSALDALTPYFDTIVAILVMLMMLPKSIKMLWNAIKDVFLFSPDENTVEQIKEICSRHMSEKKYNPRFFDVTRTGRHLWIAVYFEVTGDSLAIKDLKKISDEVNNEVKMRFSDCTCELILIP